MGFRGARGKTSRDLGEEAFPAQRAGGLGLGFATSSKLVERHAGRLSVKSDGRDCASSFVIEIPLAARVEGKPAVPGAGPEESARLSPDPVGLPGFHRTVLWEEDHIPTRVVPERLLRRRSYRVPGAASVAEARSIAARETIDFVFADIGLPDGDGCALMAELDESLHLKGIALTGYGRGSDIARSRAAGFVVHWTKPVSMRALDGAMTAPHPPGAPEQSSRCPAANPQRA